MPGRQRGGDDPERDRRGVGPLRRTLPRMTLPPAVGRSRTPVGLAGSLAGSSGALTRADAVVASGVIAGTSEEPSRTIARQCRPKPRRSAVSASTQSSSSRGWAGSRPTSVGSIRRSSRCARAADLDLRQRARPRAPRGEPWAADVELVGHRVLGKRGTRALGEAFSSARWQTATAARFCRASH